MSVMTGELRHLAKFKLPTVTKTYGDTTVDPFVEDFEAWVGIDPVTGTEETVGDQVQASRGSLVKMRYRKRQPTMRHAMFIRDEDQNWTRRFEILSILNIDERDRELQLTCREVV